MTQCDYKSHREDFQTFPKIDAVSSMPIVASEYEGNTPSVPNATWIDFIFTNI